MQSFPRSLMGSSGDDCTLPRPDADADARGGEASASHLFRQLFPSAFGRGRIPNHDGEAGFETSYTSHCSPIFCRKLPSSATNLPTLKRLEREREASSNLRHVSKWHATAKVQHLVLPACLPGWSPLTVTCTLHVRSRAVDGPLLFRISRLGSVCSACRACKSHLDALK